MFEAAMNLLLIALMIAVTAFWIAALAQSDGRCHLGDCGQCPFPDDCPEGRRKKNEDSGS